MVNLANDEGWSPLHFAARQGSAPIAELLHLTPMEQRRVIAARQRHLDDDPDDPR